MTKENIKQDYTEAIRFLYATRFFGMKLGLQNINYMLSESGNPEKKYFTIHIAGTNGKGSIAAMTESILRYAGYRTGLFTSPHISSFRERFKINGELISPDEVVRLVNLIKPVAEKMKQIPHLSSPTFFEIITAMAACYFAEKNIDIAVIETGLGGRLDATNAFPSQIQVITGIGLEHQEYLGNTIEQIAFEKAGIIKEEADVIIGEQEYPALSVIKKVAREKSAKVHKVGSDIYWSNYSIGELTQFADIQTSSNKYIRVECPLLGVHQIGNLCAVIGVVEALRNKKYYIHEPALRKGIRETKWYGRFEVVQGNPVFILDTAANPHAAKTVVHTFNNWKKPGKPVLLIFGMLKDKDPVETGKILFPLADEIILTQPESDRGLTANQLKAKIVKILSGKTCFVINSLKEALKYASEKMRNTGGYVLVTGSLFLIGRAREFLELAPIEDDVKITDFLTNGKKEKV